MLAEAWLVEMGHTRVKWARVVDGEPAAVSVEGHDRIDRAVAEMARSPATVWLAAVPEDPVVAILTGPLEQAGLEWRRVRTGRPELSIAPAYEGLGVDRWLALQPAWGELKGPFCLADAGTALTVDLVDESGRHRGGWIMPGLEAARNGLVARAPGLERGRTDPEPGWELAWEPATDTARAIERGLVLQQAGAVRAAHQAAARALGLESGLELGIESAAGLPLWLTGGDAKRLEFHLEPDRTDPHLVLRGLALAAGRQSRRS